MTGDHRPSPRSRCPLAAQKHAVRRRPLRRRRAARLVRDYNCQGCHVIGDLGRRRIRAVDRGPARGARRRRRCRRRRCPPPMLYNPTSQIGEGSRVHTDWLHGFLGDPQQPRSGPGWTCACPRSEFDEEQLNTVTQRVRVARPGPVPVRAEAGQRSRRRWPRAQDLFDALAVREVPRGGGQAPPARSPPTWRPTSPTCRQRLRAGMADALAQEPVRASSRARACRRTSRTSADENAFPDVLGGDQASRSRPCAAYLLTLGRAVRPPPRRRQAARTRAATRAPSPSGGYVRRCAFNARSQGARARLAARGRRPRPAGKRSWAWPSQVAIHISRGTSSRSAIRRSRAPRKPSRSGPRTSAYTAGPRLLRRAVERIAVDHDRGGGGRFHLRQLDVVDRRRVGRARHGRDQELHSQAPARAAPREAR